MGISIRENHIRTIRMTNPQWMPCTINLTLSAWEALGADLESLVLSHPFLWPGFTKGQVDYTRVKYPPNEDASRGVFIDSWGCLWRTTINGNVGSVLCNPLSDYDALKDFKFPDPATHGHIFPLDWEQIHRQVESSNREGRMLPGIGLDHGFHILRLEYLRGFENLMFDLLEEPEEFKTLVEKVHAFNKELVRRYIELGAPVISLPEDLGSTQGTIVGPGLIEKWVMPYYRELHDMAHAAGRFTNFHCDGNIMNIAGQILDLKPDVFNPQDRLNGIDNLAAAFKGRLCVKLDFDRGLLSSPSSTAEIAELVEEEVRKLGDRNGGLMLFAEVRGAVPLENVEALAAAMEKYSRHWFE